MTRISKRLADVDTNPPFNDIADSVESFVQDDLLNTGCEKELKPTQSDSGPIVHRLSRSLARLHGVNAAAVLRGLAWKIQRSKNYANGKKWYYECIDTLVAQRFPYFARSTLFDTISYLKKHQLIETNGWKHRYRYDRTTSFSMTQAAINATAQDLVYFDVKSATEFGIPAGLLTQNLRHFLKLKSEETPDEIPYHKLSPAQLCRDLPLSLSTIKRTIKLLEKEGEFIAHPEKAGYWTMKKDQFTIGSNPDMTGSNPDKIGSFSDMVGSNPDNDTHYKSITKPFQSRLKEQQADPSTITILERNQPDVSFKSNSVSGRADHSKDSKAACMTLKQLKNANEQFRFLFDVMETAHRDCVMKIVEKMSYEYFGSLAVERILEYHRLTDPDALTDQVHRELGPFCLQRYGSTFVNQSEHYIDVGAELIIGAIIKSQGDERFFHSFPALRKLTHHLHICLYRIVEEANEREVKEWFEKQRLIHQSPTVEDEPISELPPADKVRVFRNAVHSRNTVGWIFWEGERHTDHIQLGSTASKRLEHLFELNPGVSVAQLLTVLDRCVKLNVDAPTRENDDRHDPLWHARRGHVINRFLTNLETIIEELAMTKECPVDVFLDTVETEMMAA